MLPECNSYIIVCKEKMHENRNLRSHRKILWNLQVYMQSYLLLYSVWIGNKTKYTKQLFILIPSNIASFQLLVHVIVDDGLWHVVLKKPLSMCMQSL